MAKKLLKFKGLGSGTPPQKNPFFDGQEKSLLRWKRNTQEMGIISSSSTAFSSNAKALCMSSLKRLFLKTAMQEVGTEKGEIYPLHFLSIFFSEI